MPDYENMCDACGGTGKPLSGGECMCGGTGRMSDAARYLRRQLVKNRDEQIELALLAANAAIDAEYEALPEHRRDAIDFWERVASR